MASPDDRGGAQLAVPPSVVIAQQAQEVAVLQGELAVRTAERDDARSQLAAVTAERDAAWAARDQLQLQVTAMSSGRGAAGVSTSVPVAVHRPVMPVVTSDTFRSGSCTWYDANLPPLPWTG